MRKIDDLVIKLLEYDLRPTPQGGWEITEEMRSSFPSDWASATVGSRSTAMELVMAEGKRMKGRLIPVNTP